MQDWQKQLADVITDSDTLCRELDIDPEKLKSRILTESNFPLRVPRSFVERMQKGNPEDPLLLQVLPILEENRIVPGFSKDPLNEQESNPVPGLLHKYQGRVLLTAISACAIHCRYCFRRDFPYEKNTPTKRYWPAILEYIEKHDDLEEIILSGGDPLVLKDASLLELIERLAKIPHVKTLRIHTRLPVVIPDRITDSLITALTKTRLNTVMVIHCNHPKELDSYLVSALHKLRNTSITLLNQSVLLKKINDSSKILIELSKRLFSAGVLPYYLHLLDPVEGSAHFDLPEQKALELITAMRNALPGYCVPKLVREVPGKLSKTPVV